MSRWRPGPTHALGVPLLGILSWLRLEASLDSHTEPHAQAGVPPGLPHAPPCPPAHCTGSPRAHLRRSMAAWDNDHV